MTATPRSLRATVYYGGDLPAFGTGDELVTLECSFLDSMDDAGYGTVTCLYSDVIAQGIEPGDAIAFDVIDSDGNATPAFAMIVREIDYTAVDPSEEAGQTITFTGPGTLAILTDGLIEPPGGVGRFPVVDDFRFDYTHPEFDDSAWVAATEVWTVYEARRNADGDYATPGVDGRWAYLQVFQPVSEFTPAVSVIPDGPSILWASDGTIDGLSTGVGDCPMRDTFTTSYDGLHIGFLAADNQAELYIDGKQIQSVGFDGDVRFSGYETGGGQPFSVSLSAGTHTVAIKGTNLAPFGTPNPGGVAASLFIPGFPPTLVWQTTTSMKLLEYPSETPGMTPGTVLRLMIEAQQALGRFPLVWWDFDDDVDSNGDPWEFTPTLSVRAGTDTVYSAAQKLMALYCDVRMAPDDWLVHAYNKGTGPSSGIAYTTGAPGANITSLRYKREDRTADELLVRSELGWSRDGSSGRREGYLELGPENNVDEVGRVSDQVKGVYQDPREEVTLTSEITSDDEIPYANADLVPRATALRPLRGGGAQEDRIVQLGLAYGQDEKLTPTVVLKDRIRESQERILEMVQQR